MEEETQGRPHVTPCPGLPLAVSLICGLPRGWRELKDDYNKVVQRV